MNARSAKVRGSRRVDVRKCELIEAIERADTGFFAPWLDLVYVVGRDQTDRLAEKDG